MRLGFNVSQSFIRNNYFTPHSAPHTLKEKEQIFKIDPRIKKKKNLLRRIGKKRPTKGPKNTIFDIERNNKSLLIESNPSISQRTYSSRLIASTELRVEIEIEEKGGEERSGV